MRSSNSEEGNYTGDASEIFTQLIILIVEGRTPGGEKGYHAGPHCPQQHQSMGNRHICDPAASVCVRAESLLKQLKLMWGVGVDVSIEVLLAPDCQHGLNIASTLDTSSAPSSNLQMIEQWNFTVYDKKMSGATSTGWALVAAVRSFLHFSQLSAWLSSSGGSRPPNVLYRLTVSSAVFCSKFSATPEQHHFPLANVGLDTSIKVVVRSLPRIEQIPHIKCIQNHSDGSTESEIASTQILFACNTKESPVKSPPHNQECPISKSEDQYNRDEEDLRRCMMKAKLTESGRVCRSESPDTQLGESLLDPPNTMSRIGRRFQSPSRSGSPSLETPEHLICKVRHARPPDANAFLSPMIFPDPQPMNPFAWTQTRYPSFPSTVTCKLGQPLQGIDFTRPPNRPPYAEYAQPKPQCVFNASPSFYPLQLPPQYYWQSIQSVPSPEIKPEGMSLFSTFLSPTAQLSQLNAHNNVVSSPGSSRNSFVLEDTSSLPAVSSGPRPIPANCDHIKATSSYKQIEPQGTKRKGGNKAESPNKRESPPHTSKVSSKDQFANNASSRHSQPKCCKAMNFEEPIFRRETNNFCESFEDLTDLTDLSHKIHPQEHSNKIRPTDNSMEAVKLRKNKFKSSFELTPKETREVLSVLRHSNQLCPTKSLSKNVPPVHFSGGSVSSAKSSALCNEKISTGCKAGQGSSVPKNLIKRLVIQDAVKASPEPIPWNSMCSDPLPLKSSKNACDTSIKNSFDYNCPAKRDHQLRLEDSPDKDRNVCLLNTLIHNEKNLSRCVEAKRITEKTNSFTISSQPTVGKSNAITEIAVGVKKNPFSHVLSGIKRSTPQSCDDKEPRTVGEPSKVHRCLEFCDVKQEQKFVDIASHLDKKSPVSFEAEVRQKRSNLLDRLVNSELISSVKNLPVQETDLSLILKTSNGADSRNVPDSSDVARALIDKSIEEGADNEVDELCQRKSRCVPTSDDQVQFRRSLESAANLVFHNKTGLPLTSSPAPMRKGHSFDYDSTLISVAAIKSALRPCDTEEENESLTKTESVISSPEKFLGHLSSSAPATVTCSNLLGSFEESVLNGRLEPFSTVHGFKAEIAAAGSFCPKHVTKPVTVFFYTLCNNRSMSSPYMGHVNLSKKGYHVPSQGTLQVTLFNPHGTVVKMFVVMYDLSDMPANSRTFLRQRTLNMPVGEDDNHADAHQWLRYLIHLRFVSSKSGKIYLHTDIRMMIFRRCDVDAAVLHQTDTPYEVRSFTHGPTNPKFSPRK